MALGYDPDDNDDDDIDDEDDEDFADHARRYFFVKELSAQSASILQTLIDSHVGNNLAHQDLITMAKSATKVAWFIHTQCRELVENDQD